MRVDVYRNLTNGTWSVKSLQTGLVEHRPVFVAVRDAEFVVQPSGLRRVRESGQKDVHAFVRGQRAGEIRLPEGDDYVQVTYNPFKFDSFVTSDTHQPVYKADLVLLLPEGLVYAFGAH